MRNHLGSESEQGLIDQIKLNQPLKTGNVLNYFSVLGRKTGVAKHLSLSHHMGVVNFSPSDQVVTVRSGTKFGALQQELAEHGQCIPHKFPLRFNVGDTEIGNMIDFNLPHALEGQCGNWRDWILGMRIILADGTICVAGSHAVKNVAGYDVQKLFIGARGTLGVISEVIFKTFPIKALPTRETTYGPMIGNDPIYIHRTLPSRFDTLIAEAGSRLMSADAVTATLWAGLDPRDTLTLQPGDWVMRSGAGERNLWITDPTQIRLMKRAKEIFDPTHKLNPGEMGIF